MYHYTQCGLDNVWLDNGYEIKSTPYGKAVAVGDVDGLHAMLAATLAEKKGPLSGKEFRFLRVQLGLTQDALASLMGVTEGALSLWERKGSVPRVNDQMLRLMVLAQGDAKASLARAMERVQTVDKLVNQRYVVRAGDRGREVLVRPVRRPAGAALTSV